MNKQSIIEYLQLDDEQYLKRLHSAAAQDKNTGTGPIKQSGILYPFAMLGYTNICKNNCLYCGLRASNKIDRYRMSVDEILDAAGYARREGFGRIFLIAGEDPRFGFTNLFDICERIHAMGMYIALAAGEFTYDQFRRLAKAGVDEYVLKFEMSQEAVFNRLNPSTNFQKRMQAIHDIQESGMLLASGNIVGYPGQTVEMIAEDILLMKELNIHWAPIIPYMPVLNTPLAMEGKAAGRVLTLKEISVLREIIPEVRVTAQQPGDDFSKGLSDLSGNLDAILAGANVLFYDLLPDVKSNAFRVIDNRKLSDQTHLERVAKCSGCKLAMYETIVG